MYHGPHRDGPTCPEHAVASTSDAPAEVIDIMAEVRAEKQDIQELTAELTRLKEEGNALYQKGEFSDAVAVYTRALEVARNGWRTQVKTTEQAKKILNPLIVSLNCNKAAVHLKLAPLSAEVPLLEYAAAEAAASAALNLDTWHVKSLYRRGVARAQLGRLKNAREDLLAACRADPKDRTARAELERVQAALRSSQNDTSRESRSAFAAPPSPLEERDAARKREKDAVRTAAEAAVQAALAGGTWSSSTS